MIEKIKQWFIIKFTNHNRKDLTEKIDIHATFTSEEESLKAIQELSKYIAEMNPCSLESTLSIERFPAGYRIVISIIIEKSKHSKCTSYLSDVSSWIYDAKTICSYNVCVHL